ncbi:dihydropteroate synthase [Enemella sp. A6]|uniref:dihydropteroate synthase n=1 Tax=Enemella sp. A6 TaxID=3440152 RepID=UPI003EBF536A
MIGNPPTRGVVRTLAGRVVDFSREVHAMAIVNRSPDSFHDRGATATLEAAVAAGVRAVDQGADWVDIGGIPFSPDTPLIDARAETDRVLPVVTELLAARRTIVAVDTWRPEVGAACVAAGAAVLNDTSGLADPDMARLAADTGAQLVICHSLAEPHRHLHRPRYDDVVDEVRAFLSDRVELALSLGVTEEQVIVDPGPDLNKTTRHTLELIRRFDEITCLGFPTLVAVSNKDVIGETLGRPREERIPGSIAAGTWCLAAGGSILRVHDVSAGIDTVRMAAGIRGWREPAHERHNL